MIKLVKDTIVTAISDIVIGLITESVSDGKMTIKENIKFWSFKKKTKKWLREFIKKNDGTILTSGNFEDFLKYYKPIEKIYEHLLQSNGDITTKEELMDGLVGQLKVFFNDDEREINVLDESVVRELLVKIYTEYEEYLTSGLSGSEQYLKASILKNQKSESKRQLEYSNNNIREIIEHTSKIKNPEEVMKVYDILSQEIRKGNIEQVHDLLPFLRNKNADIDMAMQIKLSLLSDYQCLDMEALEAWKKIKSNYISDDITRILILYWFDKKEKMTQLEKLIKNSDLKEIAGIISRDEKEKFMKLEKKNRHHVDNYEFSLTGQYSNEKWLVNRVCALWLAEKPIINIHELIQQLFGNNLSYIEEIYVLEKEQDTIVNTISLENVKEDGRVKEIGKILSGMKQKIAHNNNKIKLLYYRTFLKNQVVLEEKNIELLNEIPDVIKKDSAIETMMIQYKIDLGCVDEEAVVEFCERAGTYWLYCNLLRKKCNNWNQVKESIESHNGILEKDIYLFLLYVQSIRVCDGKEAAITEWKKYQSVYKDYVEYWLEIFKVYETERKMLPELFEKWKDGQLEWLDPEAEVDFAKVLIDCQYYKEAMQIVEKKEALGQVSPDILRLKAKLLMEDNQAVTALDILLNIFDNFQSDLFVVDATIVLSLNLQRNIPQKVIDAAIKIGTARLLTLVAGIYSRENKKAEAKKLMLKALLRNKDNGIGIFGNYLMLQISDSDSTERKIDGIENDTAVVLQGVDGEKLIYCIYEENILPDVPYIWQGATHIYRDQAITIGLLRKKTGDLVMIEGREYHISEIMPVDGYLIRLCLEKLVKANAVKTISIETRDGKLDVENFSRELMKYIPGDEKEFNWLDNYKDFSSFPLPFAILQKTVRVNTVQLIMTLVQSEDIIVRERYDEDLIRGQQFVLSFAAVIMLYMIGVKPEFLKERQVFVPESMRNTILTMCTDIINENDKEHVSSIGVREKRLYMNVVSESEKVQILGEAAALKNFVSQLNTWSNNREFCDVQDEERDWLDVFGISDYDALALAQGKKAVIVTGEVTIQSLIQEIKLNISGMGILNFLVALKMDVYVLLDCIEQMIKYRFEITMTEKCLRYIIDEYSKLENQELKEDFMCKWIDCLTLVESMGDEYKEVYAQNMMRVCQDIIREEYEVLNPVWRNYFSLCVKYKCGLETK